MPQKKRRKSIYRTLYAGASIIFFLFFAHNVFSDYYLDVLHLNREFILDLRPYGLEVQHSFVVRDVFLCFDAPNRESKLDIQIYVFRLGGKLIQFCLALLLVQTLRVLNLFLRELPGRSCENIIAIMWCFVALFTYDILDFIIHAGQSDWKIQSIGFFLILSVISVLVKDKET